MSLSPLDVIVTNLFLLWSPAINQKNWSEENHSISWMMEVTWGILIKNLWKNSDFIDLIIFFFLPESPFSLFLAPFFSLHCTVCLVWSIQKKEKRKSPTDYEFHFPLSIEESNCGFWHENDNEKQQKFLTKIIWLIS